MGAPDQTIDKDAHASILHDGRRLTPVDMTSYSGAGQGHNDEAYDTTLVLRFADARLVPDTLHIHTHGFTVTKWESKYSSIWSDANWRDTPWRTQKLVPVVDASYCVIGHAGWIRAPYLCVPTETVSYDPSKVDRNIFWELLEELRLKRAFEQAPSREAARHFSLAVDGHASAADLPTRTSPAPQNWEANGLRYRNNVNYFLSGGGKAVVGDGVRDSLEIFESGDYAEYVSDYETVGGVIRHRKDCYTFLVLVDPKGYVQAVLDDGIVPPPTFGEKALEFALGLIDVTLAILLVVDIVTIPVVLLRAGLVVARAAAIRAVELVADQFTKTVERMAARDVQELLKMVRLGHFSAEELKFIRGGAAVADGPLISAERLNEIIPRGAGAEGAARRLSDPERNSVRKILGVLERMRREPDLEQVIKKMLVDLQPAKDGGGKSQFLKALRGYAEEAAKRKTVAKALRDLAEKGEGQAKAWNELVKLSKTDKKIGQIVDEANKTQDWAKFKENLAQFVKDVEDPPPWADIRELTAKKLQFGKLAHEGWHEIYVTEAGVGLLNQMRVLFRLNAGQLEADILMMH